MNSVETSDVKNEREKWLSPRTEAAWTTIAAAVYLLTTVLIVGLVAIYLGAYDDETVDDAMTGLEFFGTIPLAITFLMWVYRASNNLKAIGVEEQRFSPWGAVGWWFVPFANLVLPGKAVIEIWSKSSTKEQVSQAIPLAWWFTFIISRVLFSILDLIPVEHVTSEYVTLIGLGFISATLLDTVALGLMLAVVWTITTNQIKRHDKMQPTTPSDGLEIEDQTWAHDRSR